MGCCTSNEHRKGLDDGTPMSAYDEKSSNGSKCSPKRHGLPALAVAASKTTGPQLPHRTVRGEGIGHARFIHEKTGKIWESYNFDRKIGQGAYGHVRKATHKEQSQVRAIKTMAKSQKVNLERFRKEIAIMKMTDHPGIVKLFETFEDTRNVYLVMEICLGGELFDRIVTAGHFSEACAAAVLQQILRSVFYLHESGIVHRDLKPENFLLLNKGRIDTNVVKIIDFGLSSHWSPGDELLHTKVGTPYYVAPQVLDGEYDNMCDLWSCGVIMYVMLAGCPPFKGKTDAEVFFKVRAGLVSFEKDVWLHISNDAKNLIKNLLKLKPEERYTAQQALGHKWIKESAPSTLRVSLRPGFVEDLRAFRSENKLKKAALHIISGRLSEERIKGLRDTFVSLDDNGDGLLTLDELKGGLQQSGLQEIPEDLQIIMDGIDADGSGSIDYSEFLAASLDRNSYLQDDALRAAFSVFDIDGNGFISRAEISKVLSVDGVSEAIGLENADAVIAAVDTDGDGQINFMEFMAMMQREGRT